MERRKPVTTGTFRKMKREGQPITMVTAYDYPSAKLADEAGVDAILVGDSLGNVVLGHESTIPVTLEDMIHHTKAVTRAVETAFVVADMPFMTFHGSLDETLRNVARLMQEGLCKGVKMEGGTEIAGTVKAITQAGVPVMGHIGLTPQSLYQIGGYKVQGKNSRQVRQLIDDALRLEEAGVFSIVLELVTEEVAAEITERLSVPTIGIGSGPRCDGQVLVFHDLLQYGSGIQPKRFVKTYADVGTLIRQSIAAYVKDVKERRFPEDEHGFKGDAEVLDYLYGHVKS